MKQHLSFLEKNHSNIESAGPLFHVDSKKSAGGVWLVNADAEDTVHELVKEDPFWPTGLRKEYTVVGWKQVFANGKCIINPT